MAVKPTSEVVTDLEAWGAPVNVIEDARQRETRRPFGIYRENAQAVEAFLVVATQFSRTGFDYAGVRAGLTMAGIKITPELFQSIQTMEYAALAKLHEDT